MSAYLSIVNLEYESNVPLDNYGINAGVTYVLVLHWVIGTVMRYPNVPKNSGISNRRFPSTTTTKKWIRAILAVEIILTGGDILSSRHQRLLGSITNHIHSHHIKSHYYDITRTPLTTLSGTSQSPSPCERNASDPTSSFALGKTQVATWCTQIR